MQWIQKFRRISLFGALKNSYKEILDSNDAGQGPVKYSTSVKIIISHDENYKREAT